MRGREAFRNAQSEVIAQEFSNLVEDDQGASALFLDLACDTWDSLPDTDMNKKYPYWPSANSSWNLAVGDENPKRAALGEPLQDRWLKWRGIYAQLLRRNPRLQLAEQLQDISEMHSASSWPVGYEDLIEDWVLSGDCANPPFEHQGGAETVQIHARLVEMRVKVGGWLYYFKEAHRVLFADEAEWAVKKSDMRADRAEMQFQVAALRNAMDKWQNRPK